MKRRALVGAGAVALAGVGGLTWAQTGSEPASERDIVIGQSVVLTGPLGGPAKLFISGAQMAFDAQNASGGIQGRRLRLVVLDDELNPAKAAANFGALAKEHRALVLFGAFGTQTVSAALPTLKSTGLPLIGNFAVADPVREEMRGLAYFVRADYKREAQAIVRHLRTVGISRVAVAYFGGPGGDGVLVPIREELARDKLDIVGSAPVKNDGSNLSDVVKQLAGSHAQAFILSLGGPVVAKLLQALLAQGVTPSFYGLSSVSGELVAQTMGADLKGLTLTQVVPYPWAATEPLAREFRRRAQTAGTVVNYASYEGYLNALVLIEALKRCGKNLSPERLHSVMKSLNLRLDNFLVDFSANGVTGARFIELVRVTAGGHFVR